MILIHFLYRSLRICFLETRNLQPGTRNNFSTQRKIGCRSNSHINNLAHQGFVETIEPNSPLAIAGVASALACKYARDGDPNDKKMALELLQRAKALPEGADQIAPYEQRILFRLETREIIDRDEFDRRFPGGWSPPAGAQPEKP